MKTDIIKTKNDQNRTFLFQEKKPLLSFGRIYPAGMNKHYMFGDFRLLNSDTLQNAEENPIGQIFVWK